MAIVLRHFRILRSIRSEIRHFHGPFKHSTPLKLRHIGQYYHRIAAGLPLIFPETSRGLPRSRAAPSPCPSTLPMRRGRQGHRGSAAGRLTPVAGPGASGRPAGGTADRGVRPGRRPRGRRGDAAGIRALHQGRVGLMVRWPRRCCACRMPLGRPADRGQAGQGRLRRTRPSPRLSSSRPRPGRSGPRRIIQPGETSEGTWASSRSALASSRTHGHAPGHAGDGHHFVLGQTIDEALKRGSSKGRHYRYSFDMLGKVPARQRMPAATTILCHGHRGHRSAPRGTSPRRTVPASR